MSFYTTVNNKFLFRTAGCSGQSTNDGLRMLFGQMVLKALATTFSLITSFTACCLLKSEKQKVCKFVFSVFYTNFIT